MYLCSEFNQVALEKSNTPLLENQKERVIQWEAEQNTQGRSTEAGENAILKGPYPKSMKPKQHCSRQTPGTGSARPFEIYGLLISRSREIQNTKPPS